MPRLAALLVPALLLGCAHQIYITSRTGHVTGHTAITTSGQSSGEMSIALGGKTYAGRWVYVSGPGSVSVISATSMGGVRPAFGTGTGIAAPTGGGGSVILSAPDGSSLRCWFSYSGWSQTGMGECRDSTGAAYDLQITR